MRGRGPGHVELIRIVSPPLFFVRIGPRLYPSCARSSLLYFVFPLARVLTPFLLSPLVCCFFVRRFKVIRVHGIDPRWVTRLPSPRIATVSPEDARPSWYFPRWLLNIGHPWLSVAKKLSSCRFFLPLSRCGRTISHTERRSRGPSEPSASCRILADDRAPHLSCERRQERCSLVSPHFYGYK